MLTTYGDHFELDDGTLVPGPGRYHPALEPYVDTVRNCLHDSDVVEVVVPRTLDYWAPDYREERELSYQTLEFRQRRVVARDDSGAIWWWIVWMDQFGRGIAGRRHRADP